MLIHVKIVQVRLEKVEKAVDHMRPDFRCRLYNCTYLCHMSYVLYICIAFLVGTLTACCMKYEIENKICNLQPRMSNEKRDQSLNRFVNCF
jgi:hypothetical protein